MKRIFIIHGWSFGPKDSWYEWAKGEFEKMGYEIYLPQMPLTIAPVIPLWVRHLRKIVGTPDENTYFIGHSIGCQAIMRYLSHLPEGTKVGGAVFVAGWFYLDNINDLASKIVALPWLKTKIDLSRVKEACPDVRVLLSSNESYGFVDENKNKFENDLAAQVVILENRKHFSDEKKLPELVSIFESVTKLKAVS